MADRVPVVLGTVGAAYGVHGWVRVTPFTESRDTLLDYAEWQIGRDGQWRAMAVVAGRGQGRQLVVQLAGVASREAARALTGAEVAVWRHQLPPLEHGEHYWSDLVGLEVWNRDGVWLGRIERVMDTGANDVLVLRGERERLIPYLVDDVVLAMDFDTRRMEVDWDPEF